jgi:hypothetical protein
MIMWIVEKTELSRNRLVESGDSRDYCCRVTDQFKLKLLCQFEQRVG